VPTKSKSRWDTRLSALTGRARPADRKSMNRTTTRTVDVQTLANRPRADGPFRADLFRALRRSAVQEDHVAHKRAQITFKPDWTQQAKAAPFKRNDAMPETLPIGVMAFLRNGIQNNLVDRARKLGIPVWRVRARSARARSPTWPLAKGSASKPGQKPLTRDRHNDGHTPNSRTLGDAISSQGGGRRPARPIRRRGSAQPRWPASSEREASRRVPIVSRKRPTGWIRRFTLSRWIVKTESGSRAHVWASPMGWPRVRRNETPDGIVVGELADVSKWRTYAHRL
jgi:hypothetical protein